MQHATSLTASRTTCCRTNPQLIQVTESDTYTTKPTHSKQGEVVIAKDDGLQASSSLVDVGPVERGVVAAEPQPDGPVAPSADVDAARVAVTVGDRRVTAVMTAPVAAAASQRAYNAQRHFVLHGSGAAVQGVRTPALLIRVPFLKRTVSKDITGNA